MAELGAGRNRDAPTGCFHLGIAFKLALALDQFVFNAIGLQWRKILNEDMAVQMVNLMLNSDCEQSGCVDRETLTVAVKCRNHDRFGALDFIVIARHR